MRTRPISKRKQLTGTLLGLFLLSLTTPGFAENRAGAYSLSPLVGGHTFDSKQDLETSPTFGLRAGYNFTENWAAEAVFSYTLAEAEQPNFPETDAYSYGVDALYHFNPRGNFVPFLAAGLGGTTFERPAKGLGDSSEWLFNYGVGVKYFIADSVALRGDVRHVVLPDDSLSNLVYTAGVTFLLGGEKQAVAPTARVSQDAAKDTTAPFVTLAIPFNASTGAPVHAKTRIAFSEAMDPATISTRTFSLYEGETPITGTVLAPTDTSASFTQASNLTPATLYTGKLTTGAKDLAGNPLASDYVWSFKTAPASSSETNVITINKFVMLEDTHFAHGKATLTPKGKQLLEQNVLIMKQNPDLKVRLAGYASAAGTLEYNQALSERRAAAVMTYLLKDGGIAPERMDTIGYGETRPAMYEPIPADIQSAEAKANRRVLFEVIVK